MTDKEWRYKKPPEKHKKLKEALATFFAIVVFVGLLVGIGYVLFFLNDDEPTTTTTTFTTATTLPVIQPDVTTTTVALDPISAAFCEGWKQGVAVGLNLLGMTPEQSVLQAQADALHPCDPTQNTYRASEELAWCEGLPKGQIAAVQEEWGPPPDGYVDETIVICMEEGTFNQAVFPIGGGGPDPLDN